MTYADHVRYLWYDSLVGLAVALVAGLVLLLVRSVRRARSRRIARRLNELAAKDPARFGWLRGERGGDR